MKHNTSPNNRNHLHRGLAAALLVLLCVAAGPRALAQEADPAPQPEAQGPVSASAPASESATPAVPSVAETPPGEGEPDSPGDSAPDAPAAPSAPSVPAAPPPAAARPAASASGNPTSAGDPNAPNNAGNTGDPNVPNNPNGVNAPNASVALDDPNDPDDPDGTEEEPLLGAAALTELDAASVVVDNYADLQTALSQNNGYETVYLAADITSTGGFTIHSAKQNVVIDGCPPDAPAGTRHSYTDYNSGSQGDTININSAAQSVTLRNLAVNGRNYYGIVNCGTSFTGQLVLDNLSYTGPQPIYCTRGSVLVRNAAFTLAPSSACAAQELAETPSIAFEGAVTITSASTGSAVLWMYIVGGSPAALTVRNGASVTVNTSNYFIYNDSPGTNVVVEDAASLAVTTNANGGFTYGTQTVNTLSVGAGAALSVAQNATGYTGGAVRVASQLTVGPGAAVDVACASTGTGYGIYFPGGGSAAFNSPGRVRIYAAPKHAVAFSGSGTLSITAGAVDLWPAASSLAEPSMPASIWNKLGGAPVTLTAQYSNATLTSLTSNLAAGDPAALLSASTFNLRGGAQLLTFGAAPLSLGMVTNQSAAITGTAAPGALVQASYTSALPGLVVSGSADGGGAFSLALGSSLPKLASLVTVTAGAGQLFSVQTTQVLDDTLYYFGFKTVPDSLPFGSVPVARREQLVPRQDPNWQLAVNDTRTLKGPWSVALSLPAPLTATGPFGTDTLPGALVFVGADGTPVPLSATPLKVYSQPLALLEDQAAIGWAADRGLMLLLPPGAGRPGATYTATLEWVLYDTP